MAHDLTHSQSQILGFQIYPLSHTPLSIKSSLHSHLHLSLFQICLLLQKAEVNLHTHLQVSCHIMFRVSFTLYIKLIQIDIWATHFCVWVVYINTTSTAYIYFMDRTPVHYC